MGKNILGKNFSEQFVTHYYVLKKSLKYIWPKLRLYRRMDEEWNPLTTLWKCDQNQAWYSMAKILVLSHTSSEFFKKKKS